MCRTNIWVEDDEGVKIAKNIAAFTGVPLGEEPGQVPIFDGRLPDGSRVNGTIPPVSPDGPTLTIRKFIEDPFTMINLIKFGTMNLRLAAMMWIWIEGLGAKPANFVIAGGTGSGKTTTLNVLGMYIPWDKRLLTVEDTAELQVYHDHWLRMETRPARPDGTTEISMDDCLKSSLRMRPDRIIVGEVRGPEAATLLTALNTGHILRLDFKQSSMLISVVPSGRAGLVSILNQWSWYTCNSAVSSTVSSLLSHGIYIPSTFKVVVLPEPVPPAITKFAGFAPNPSIQIHIIAANLRFMVPNLIKLIMVNGSSMNFLIVNVGPSGDTGGIVPLTRLPSGNLPSNIGTCPGSSPKGTPVNAAMFFAIFNPSSSSTQMFVLHIPNFLCATFTHC
jgi:hypothetical protein